MEGASNRLFASQAENLKITPSAAGASCGSGSERQAPSSSLLSIKKPLAKPWRKPPPLPIPPKVYRVHPRGFRELVQRLTGTSTGLPPSRSLPQEIVPAPPPAPMHQQQVYGHLHRGGSASWPSSTPAPLWEPAHEFSAAASTEHAPRTTSIAPGFDQQYSQAYPAGDFPSPSLYSACMTWCSSALLSPGSMACLEQSTVL